MSALARALAAPASESFYLHHARAWRIGLFLLALSFRAGHLVEFAATPYFDQPIVDADAYDERGWEIAQGDWIGDRIFYQDPLYPYLLALCYSVFGHRYLPVFALQALVGSALVLVVVELARRLFAASPCRERIGFASGLLCALCTPFVFYDALLLKPSLGIFFSTVHLLVLMLLGDRRAASDAKGRPWLELLAGLLLGLNLLNRGNYILLAPLFALWLVVRATPSGGFRSTLIYACGAAVVVLPVTARNYAVGGELVLVTSQGGQNFYIGNNPDNDSGGYVIVPGVRPNPHFEESDFRAIAVKETGRELSAREVSRFFFGKGLGWIRANPGQAARLFVKKWELWLAAIEPADNYSFKFLREQFCPLLRLPLSTGFVFGWLGWSALLLGAIAPARMVGWLSMRSCANRILAGLFVLAYSLSVTAFFVFGRYRLPIYPVLICLAAGLVLWLATERWWRSPALAACVAIALVGTSLCVHRTWWDKDFGGSALDDSLVEFYNLGAMAMERDLREQAETYFDRAAAQPQNRPEIALELGRMYRRLDRCDKAVATLRALAAAKPELSSVWSELGVCQAELGEHAEAERSFTRAVSLAPSDPLARRNLASLYARAGRAGKAREAFRVYLALAPEQDPAAAFADAAKILLASPEREDFEEGLVALRRALTHQHPLEISRLQPLLASQRDEERERALAALCAELSSDARISSELRSTLAERSGAGSSD